MSGCPGWSGQLLPHLWCPLVTGTRNIHVLNYIGVSEHKPSQKVSLLSYTLS